MAIPVGTTARQLAFTGRWMLAAVMMVGMLVWWYPGYTSWGALSAAMIVVLMLWLLWRTVSGERHVPGHPIHIVLAVPAIILTVHFTQTGLNGDSEVHQALAGGINVSMIFHLGVVSAGIMLTQSMLPRAARHVVVLGLCGASIMGGAAAAMVWGKVPHVHGALTLLGLGGVAVWLTPLWGISDDGAQGSVQTGEISALPHHLRRRDVRMACVGIAVIATAIFATRSPLASLWACGVVGLTLLTAGIVFPRRRIASLLCGGGLAIGSALAMLRFGWVLLIPKDDLAGAFGRGEQAFDTISASDGGLAILLGTTGWAGLGWVVLGSLACVLWMLIHARRGHGGDQGRTIVWTAATVLVSCAVLAGGGVFLPSVALAVALTWGMLPAMLGRNPRRRGGVILLIPIVVLMLILGVARNPGLAVWFVEAFGLKDKFLHGTTGLVLAASVAWLFGSRRWWLGLVAIGASVLAGGVGELIQLTATSWRDADLSDWAAHAVGSAIAIVPYLLCMGSRMCESADAQVTTSKAYSKHSYQRR